MLLIRVVILVLLLECILMIPTAAAIDGERRGFVLGFGLGGGTTSFTQTRSNESVSIESDRINSTSLITGVQLGRGLDNTTVLSAMLRIAWMRLETVTGEIDGQPLLEDVTFAHSVAVLMLTRYARPETPSLFARGGVGIASWEAPFESNAPDALLGLGALAAVGYEFTSHRAVELGLTWGMTSREDDGIELETNALSIHLSLTVTVY